jgi:hypothetical protein
MTITHERTTKRGKPKDISEAETNAIVDTLGFFFANVQEDIKKKQGNSNY